ncbi:DnaJ homolog subfamily B member 14-like [Mucor ambiguus]|uniref:DnaJ homolog subfamily B member 14-like n=1 Tax=Mucor ambiguus TaxID=91626 RepID=A0A0C9MYN3_9FUNG|nr:DnaJ homolog subfamily B member 14-like [Mucor ambiguus]
MESNKDEALKCLSIAKSSLEKGDYAKALRFTEKSIRLFPTAQGEQLLSLVNKKSSEPNKSSYTTSSAKATSTPSRQQSSTPEPAQERKYTAEQVKAVKTILACGRDYYKVLSVERTATDVQIKKAYRKQALQFHPDKNSAPGADEAFKLVAKAFDVLSDSNKRAIHDEGGDADSSRGRTSSYHQQHQQYAYNRRHGDEVSPEDLFNMFFGGGMRNNFGPSFRAQQQQQRYRQQQQRFRQQQRHQRAGDGDLSGGLSQMMPIILISILAIFALLFSFEGEPLYTFRPQPPNTNLRSTKSNHINYYVNPKVFDTTVKNNMYKFQRTERQIESEWLGELRAACTQEQRQRANLMAQADGVVFGIIGRNEKAYNKAANMKMKNCDELRRLAPKIRG